LQNLGELPSALKSVRRCLRPGGAFVFAIIHPCFWPSYWGYDKEPWFSYWEEIWISAPFRTTLMTETRMTTHVHRPLQTYVGGLAEAGFRIESLNEPRPPASILPQYLQTWQSPRFLIGLCWAE
jgi:hypothetical protein